MDVGHPSLGLLWDAYRGRLSPLRRRRVFDSPATFSGFSRGWGCLLHRPTFVTARCPVRATFLLTQRGALLAARTLRRDAEADDNTGAVRDGFLALEESKPSVAPSWLPLFAWVAHVRGRSLARAAATLAACLLEVTWGLCGGFAEGRSRGCAERIELGRGRRTRKGGEHLKDFFCLSWEKTAFFGSVAACRGLPFFLRGVVCVLIGGTRVGAGIELRGDFFLLLSP